ncbi:MAG: spore maturation protein [Rhodospirillales bacterium]|jgi:spore maturation protein SpmA|nr:spore maturation protein [Rhodospirillales bacterium]MBT4007084.1 spore maturation protein [Rhodospirillales bacterium]MBT5076909.1 spore maturation protein [Rhodospirillales bacterium]MBT5113417.1 spore maturation protein [Rhodospirillales bacterium]MBT5673715.1 spore maturation protein [Rhodospirillales bacterium]
MNLIFFLIVAVSFFVTGLRELLWHGAPAGAVGKAALSPMSALGQGMVDQAGASVTLAIGLIGVMALFLGLMKVAEAGGLLVIIARTIRPLMTRLFPDVPADHPAMGAMILNFSANILGLGNAATPFGIRAMQELDRLNPVKGTATNAMVLFLAINTSSITILPTGVIALRAAAGSTDPAAIVPTTLFATICSTAIAIFATKLYQRWSPVTEPEAGDLPTAPALGDPDPAQSPEIDGFDDSMATHAGYPTWVSVLALGFIIALVPITIFWGRAISPWIIPGIMLTLLSFGFFRGVRVYESFVDGAKDGFSVAVRIIPYLVAILVAVSMLRSSGALEMFISLISPYSGAVGLPAEALPMALLRPLSGSGAYGILASIINDPAIGPDSYAGLLVSTLQGSTETTFYVLAVYFGAVQIRRIRHGLAAGLTADAAGIAAAVIICMLLFTP